MRNWKTNAAGEISVPVPQEVVDNIIAFREKRASFQILRAAMMITDVETRKQFTEDAESILNSPSGKRFDAVSDLMTTISGSPASRGQIFYALRFLTNEAGYKNNPFLLIAFASTTAFQTNGSSFTVIKRDEAAIANAVRAANEILYNDSTKQFAGKIDRSEAIRINLMASTLYDNINDPDEATFRCWVDRFLGMSETERKSLKEGDTVSIAPPDVNSMRGPFDSEKRLQNAEQKHSETVKTWKQDDQMGKDQNFRLPSDRRRSLLYQDETDVYPSKSKDVPANDPAHSVEKVPSDFKSIYSNGQAIQITTPVTLILESGKWLNFNQRMAIITEYLNKKQALEARIRLDNYHLVPPPPGIIEKYIKDFRRDGRITVNPFQKTKIIGVLSQLNGLLEESYAVWGKK